MNKWSFVRSRNVFIVMSLLAVSALSAGTYFGFVSDRSQVQHIEIFHLPTSYFARDGALTLNVTGTVHGQGDRERSSIKYRLNEGPWQALPQGKPRVPSPNFTIEIYPEQLQEGDNCIAFTTLRVVNTTREGAACFKYLPRPQEPSTVIDWTSHPLDVQDGKWETLTRDGATFARPSPGHEDYDRILMATGAFRGGRRVEADFIFRRRSADSKPYGFGILPLWGGHQEDSGHFPRRGWAYGLAWYYSVQNGIGAEIATKVGAGLIMQTNTYQTYKVEEDRRYRMITEAQQLPNDSETSRFRVRLKWWADGDVMPEEWITVVESDAKRLPHQAFAVALLAHRAQVEFYSVRIIALP